MIELAQSLMIGVAVVGIPLSLFFWILCFDRMQKRQPLIPWSPRRPVPWTIIDLMVIFLIGIVTVSAMNGMVAKMFGFALDSVKLEDLQPNQQLALLIAASCGSMAVLMLSLAFVRFRSGASFADLGLTPVQIKQDLLLGLTAFIMLVVPMLAIQLLATYLIQTEERHPFIDVILQTPDVRFLIIIAFAATVAAPLGEEFLFRVILLGWMERVIANLTAEPHELEAVPTDADQRATSPDTFNVVETNEETVSQAAARHQEIDKNPFSPPALHEVGSEQLDPACEAQAHEIEPKIRLWWFPILVSGILFGLAHLGQGPAPIALVFLGCGLGYVYHRTHRVLPCITVHFLVNLLAIAQLAVYIAQPVAP